MAFCDEGIDERRAFESPSQGATATGRADSHMVVVAPEVDLVTRFYPEFVSQFLGDHDLALRPNSMSHTYQYNSTIVRE